MNKRQKKKLGLLDQTIKIGHRVLIVKNSSSGHNVGTVGNVIELLPSDRCVVLAPYEFKFNGNKIVRIIRLKHPLSDLKKLQNKGVRYYL